MKIDDLFDFDKAMANNITGGQVVSDKSYIKKDIYEKARTMLSKRGMLFEQMTHVSQETEESLDALLKRPKIALSLDEANAVATSIVRDFDKSEWTGSARQLDVVFYLGGYIYHAV